MLWKNINMYHTLESRAELVGLGVDKGSCGQNSHQALVGQLTTHVWAICCY